MSRRPNSDYRQRYKWNQSFNFAEFKRALDDHNKQESEVALNNTSYWDPRGRASVAIPAARITYGDSVVEALSPKHDIIIPLRLDRSFMEFANTQIVAALQQARELAEITDNDCGAPLTLIRTDGGDDEEVFALWRLNKILNWQMLDRRIDECGLSSFLGSFCLPSCLKDPRGALGLSSSE